LKMEILAENSFEMDCGGDRVDVKESSGGHL